MQPTMPSDTPRLPHWFRAAALRAELAPLPGRATASLRMLIACLLIVTVSMALQIPNAALSAYMVFFVSREDMATTARSGIALIVAVTVAIGLTLLADMVTIDAPALRLALMTVLFCAGMYLSRVFVAGALGFGLGFILLVTQSTVDLYPAAEPLVRDTLWTWMALFFSIVIVVLVNALLLPARPLVLLRQEARGGLASVIAAIDARLADGVPAGASSAPDAAHLEALLKLASASSPAVKQRLPSYAAVLQALSHLVDAAWMLAELSPPLTVAAQTRLLALRMACTQLRDAVGDSGIGALPQWAPAPVRRADDKPPLDEPLIAELEHHLCEIVRLWPSSGQAAEAGAVTPAPARRLFVADALTNPAHQQFALKATFAAILCYIVYTALAWPGIHTCVITCAVIALTSTGATIHKAALRIAGALAGGALALLVTVFVAPHLESIGGLLLTIAPVVAASAWIAAGSERTAYFGWQVAFAFFLSTLHGYGPNDDVTVVRDRVLGILFGIAVMGAVFKLVWPERAGQRVNALLARATEASAALLQDAAHQAQSSTEFAARRRAILSDLDEAAKLAGVAAFEAEAAAPGPELVAAARRAALHSLHLAQLAQLAQQAAPAPPARAGTDSGPHLPPPA